MKRACRRLPRLCVARAGPIPNPGESRARSRCVPGDTPMCPCNDHTTYDATMQDATEQRAGLNESAFRRVNESIRRGVGLKNSSHAIAIVCECARLGCSDVLEVEVGAYEQVRLDPTRFVISHGHEVPDVEQVIERTAGYAVVQKLGAAAEVAEENDPRAEG